MDRNRFIKSSRLRQACKCPICGKDTKEKLFLGAPKPHYSECLSCKESKDDRAYKVL